MAITVREIYDYAFEHFLLDEDVEAVLNRMSKEPKVTIQQSIPMEKGSSSKWDTLVEYSYEDLIELLSL